MTDPVALPYDIRRWANIRILVTDAWGNPWIKLPMLAPTRNGYTLLRYRRVCLPDEGTAVFSLPYGKIDGRLFVDTTFEGELSAPDLLQYEVRIQGQLSTEEWRTIWWGQCVAMRDGCFPGSEAPAGTIEYHCVDGFARLRRWYLDYHQSAWDGSSYRGRGHPGYNVLLGRGNRDVSELDLGTGLSDGLGLGFNAHTWYVPDTDVAVEWTDQEAVEHALLASVPGLNAAGTSSLSIELARLLHPSFPIFGSLDWLQGKNVWPVREMQTVRTFLEQVFERGRAKGLAFCDWTDDTSEDPTDALEPRITINPALYEDLDEDLPSGAELIAEGALAAATSVDVNVIGDHRLGEDAQRTFQIAAVSDIQYSGVEVLGEPIQSLCMLTTNDASLNGRWNGDDETALIAASTEVRKTNEAKYDHVLTRYGIPRDWDLRCGDGHDVSRTRIDYRCNDDGSIRVPDAEEGNDTSPLIITIADRLPLYHGYDYTVSPVVAIHGTPPGDLDRLPVGVWVRTSDSPERWVNAAKELGISVARREQDLHISCAQDQGGIYRRIGYTDEPSLHSRYSLDQMAILVALETSHRVRILVGEDNEKTKRIYVKDHHLWLAHPKAIIALDPATKSDGGYAPLRIGTSDVVILRDDRDRLATIAHQAAVWYLRRRFTATWTLRDIGFSDGWHPALEDGLEDPDTLIPWPKLGDLVNTFSYSGREESLGTPITLVEYNHVAGTYTWATSWSHRDWR